MSSFSSTLEKIKKGNLCAGCGACAALAPNAITMALSEEGFFRPALSAPLAADQDSAIAEVCPGLGYEQPRTEGQDHDLWGPFAGIYQGHAVDEALRHQASSGGALSAILIHLVKTGAVDHIVQTGADPELPIGNCSILTSDADAIAEAAGSRYAPSAPLADIERFLESGHRYAFVGKPCDVAALRTMERRDPRVRERFPYMLSFFCAGVPSLFGAREVLSALGVVETDLASFRYRAPGGLGSQRQPVWMAPNDR